MVRNTSGSPVVLGFEVLHNGVMVKFLFGLFLLWSSQGFGQEYYGAYGLYPTGPNRVTALGGAFTGLSDDASGITYNPAGLAYQQAWGDLGGNYNIVYNREADLDQDGTKDGLPYFYLYGAGSLAFESWSMGVGISSPYAVDLAFDAPNGSFTDSRKLQLNIISIDMAFAFKVFETLSVGATLKTMTLEETFTFSSNNPASTAVNLQHKSQNSTVTSGIIYRPSDWWGLGITHTPEVRFSVDTDLNNQTNGFDWFRPVVIPAKTTIGTFVRPHPQWLFLFDVDRYELVTNSVYVGSELISTFSRHEIKPVAQYVVHGGLEWNMIATKWWDFYLRTGYYYEPARLRTGDSRSHFTTGLELRFWIISISASFDMAPEFLNTASGIGATLKYYL